MDWEVGIDISVLCVEWMAGKDLLYSVTGGKSLVCSTYNGVNLKNVFQYITCNAV